MNARIHELISQAQKEVWGNNPYNGSPEFEGYELDSEKFAELIVGECAGIALKSGNITNKSEIAVAEANRIYHKIKEHFGV